MTNNLKYFTGSFILTLLGLIGGFWLGGMKGVFIVAVLAVLETSLSFDNAVVNAKVLKHMDPVWRKRFLTWGIIIAVFGMRIVFPLLIVGVVASLGPIDVVKMAVYEPDQYAAVLTSAHHQIAAFGGAFLMMVFLKFFFDANKDLHWVHLIEAPLTRLGKMQAVEVGITTLFILLVSASMKPELRLEFIVAGAWGLITYILADGIGGLFGDEEESEGHAGGAVAKQGLAGFLYLELLDASFSFEGVIGAFALSNNLFIIAIGLSVGALFVRSFTLLLVDKGTLSAYRYLEHGAFWAIGALAAVMFASVHVHVPEVVTGLVGAVLIGLALWSSVRANRREAVAA